MFKNIRPLETKKFENLCAQDGQKHLPVRGASGPGGWSGLKMGRTMKIICISSVILPQCDLTGPVFYFYDNGFIAMFFAV